MNILATRPWVNDRQDVLDSRDYSSSEEKNKGIDAQISADNFYTIHKGVPELENVQQDTLFSSLLFQKHLLLIDLVYQIRWWLSEKLGRKRHVESLFMLSEKNVPIFINIEFLSVTTFCLKIGLATTLFLSLFSKRFKMLSIPFLG